MAPGSKCLKIVRYYAPRNAGTGETYYVTEDGRHWKDVWSTSGYDQMTAPPEVRYHHDGHLCPDCT